MTAKEKKQDYLRVRNVDDETKEQLRTLALARYGKPNASQYVRDMIYESLKRKQVSQNPPDMSTPMRRFQTSVPEACFKQLELLAEERFCTPQYFVAGLIYERLGVTQLHNDEVEVLRNSNYNLAKIGTNINQIARAFNQLVMHYQGKDKLPPIGREMDKLKKTIADHIDRVLKMLERGTIITETKGRGSGNEKRNASSLKKKKHFSPRRN